LNEAKTCIKQARTESFDFLGYTLGTQYFRKNGRRYLGARPSKKSLARLRQKVADHLRPSNVAPWSEVRDRLNMILRGWSNYFSYGTTVFAHRVVDNYVYDRVRHFLRRRHKVGSRGGTRFSGTVVFGELGVHSLCGPSPRARPKAG